MYFLCVLCSHHRGSHCIGNGKAKIAIVLFQGLALSADAEAATQKLKARSR